MRKGYLRNEAYIYKKLKGKKGVPEVYWFGMEGDYSVLVMEWLGPSLETIFKRLDCQFSVATILGIGIQLVLNI